jgi:hypothetical protein
MTWPFLSHFALSCWAHLLNLVEVDPKRRNKGGRAVLVKFKSQILSFSNKEIVITILLLLPPLTAMRSRCQLRVCRYSFPPQSQNDKIKSGSCERDNDISISSNGITFFAAEAPELLPTLCFLYSRNCKRRSNRTP